MTALRGLADSLPALLNPLLDAGQSLAYGRFFVLAEDGFGQYPRFKDWTDVSDRVCAFREAISEVAESWLGFLAWWSNATGNEKIAAELRGDLSLINSTRLYDLLLTVMLNTPASWGDRIYWLLYREKGLLLRPFLARWTKNEQLNPWHVTVECFDAGKIVEMGQADIAVGSLPDKASDLAPIFWDFLYPLCNRESYSPPQDPAKYASGAIHELILPVADKSGEPIGWAMCHVQAPSDSQEVLASLTQAPFAAILKDFEKQVQAVIQDE